VSGNEPNHRRGAHVPQATFGAVNPDILEHFVAASSSLSKKRLGRDNRQVTQGEVKGGGMRVVVDRDRCESNAVCVRIAPEVFQLDDDGYALVTADPVPVEWETLAKQAIAECPRAALSRKD
jgi:ferredoxin